MALALQNKRAYIDEHRLSHRLSDSKEVESYEVLSVSKATNDKPEIYKVCIIFVDGDETIERGDLFYFNYNYEITTIRSWLKF